MQPPSHTNDDAAALLAQGVSALKDGDMARAKDLIAQSIRLNPRNEYAWLWLSGVVATDEERRRCLERVLELNPANDAARHGLAVLARAATAPVAPLTPRPPAPPARPPELEHTATQAITPLPDVAPPMPAAPAATHPTPAPPPAPLDQPLWADPVSPSEAAPATMAPPTSLPTPLSQPPAPDEAQTSKSPRPSIRPLTRDSSAGTGQPGSDSIAADPLASLRPVAQERKIDWLRIALIVLVGVVIVVGVVIAAQVFLAP